jgi:hypothetical protein
VKKHKLEDIDHEDLVLIQNSEDVLIVIETELKK